MKEKHEHNAPEYENSENKRNQFQSMQGRELSRLSTHIDEQMWAYIVFIRVQTAAHGFDKDLKESCH